MSRNENLLRPPASNWWQAGGRSVITSLEQTDAKVKRLTSIAEDLLCLNVKTIEEVGGGRNSRVHRVVMGSSGVYALKSYFQHASDKRQRLSTEFESLRFLRENGVENVPKPVAASSEHNVAIYEWIDGQKIAGNAIDITAISTASSFLAGLQSLRRLPESRSFQTASEACFSGQALSENVQSRLEPLLSCDGHEGLTSFLSRDFVPAYTRIADWSRQRAGARFSTELPEENRILSPSDFGFHNALCCEEGEIYFLDFEYFGWDEPAKTIADFLLHPAMPLAHHHKQKFAQDVVEGFSFDSDLADRVKAYYPLFGLKWCLILLNEFLPDQTLRRRFAAAKYHSDARQNEQLTKAKTMLNQIVTEYECFPYLD
jgi:hypothetical protein